METESVHVALDQSVQELVKLTTYSSEPFISWFVDIYKSIDGASAFIVIVIVSTKYVATGIYMMFLIPLSLCYWFTLTPNHTAFSSQWALTPLRLVWPGVWPQTVLCPFPRPSLPSIARSRRL